MINKEYTCIKEYTFYSWPNNYTIKVNEKVVLLGYVFGNPVIQLDNTIHKSEYSHLSHVSPMIEPDTLAEYFI